MKRLISKTLFVLMILSLVGFSTSAFSQTMMYFTDESGATISQLAAGESGDTVYLTADIPAGETLNSYTVEVSYDPQIVSIASYDSIGFPDPGSGHLYGLAENNLVNENKIVFTGFSTLGLTGAATVNLASIAFMGIADGTSPMNITVNNFGSDGTNQFPPLASDITNLTVDVSGVPAVTADHRIYWVDENGEPFPGSTAEIDINGTQTVRMVAEIPPGELLRAYNISFDYDSSCFNFTNINSDLSLYSSLANPDANGGTTFVVNGFDPEGLITGTMPFSRFVVFEAVIDPVGTGACTDTLMVTPNVYGTDTNNQFIPTNLENLTVNVTSLMPVITATASSGGTISPSGAVSVTSGNDQTFTLTAANGYYISDLIVDSASVGAQGTYTFTNVTADHTIHAVFSPVTGGTTWAITPSAGEGGSISPNYTVSVSNGGSQTFTVTPDTGYAVDQVLVDGAVVSLTNGQYTFNNVTTNHTISVSFAMTGLFIQATSGEDGTFYPKEGSIEVEEGDDYRIVADADPGYQVERVVVDGIDEGSLPFYEFENIIQSHTIHATFEESRVTATVDEDEEDGVVTVFVDEDGNLVVIAIPDEGFIVETALLDEEPVELESNDDYKNFAVIPDDEEDHTFHATFMPATYVITASAAANGTIDPEGEVEVPANADQTFTMTPAAGYMIGQVMVDGTAVDPAEIVNNQYTFNEVVMDHTISVTFTMIPVGNEYTITTATDGMGYITPAGASAYAEGSTPTFSIIPNSGYMISQVYVDEVPVGSLASYTFAPLDADHIIFAAFKPAPVVQTYTITATAGAGGSISPSGSISVTANGGRTFNITPDAGYQITDVQVDGASVGAVTQYTFSNVTANHTIDVMFEEIPVTQTYEITASSGANGSILPSGVVSVDSGDDAQFTITPDQGYRILSVMVDGIDIGKVSTYTFTNVTMNHSIQAMFAQTVLEEYVTSAVDPTATIGVHAGANVISLVPNSVVPVDPAYLGIPLPMDNVTMPVGGVGFAVEGVQGENEVRLSFSDPVPDDAIWMAYTGNSWIITSNVERNADGTYTFTIWDNNSLDADAAPGIIQVLAVGYAVGVADPCAVTVNYTAVPTSGDMPLEVSFEASVSENAINPVITWDFGDGSTATGMTATHTYETDGTYTATLTLTVEGCGTPITRSKTIRVDRPAEQPEPLCEDNDDNCFINTAKNDKAPVYFGLFLMLGLLTFVGYKRMKN